MRKSSLGRRNSNRPSTTSGRLTADLSTGKKSGIPLPRSRAKSTERQSMSNASNRMKRTLSSGNLNMMTDMMTPARTPVNACFQMGAGTERPARTMSYGTPSASIGTSSYGGHKSKRDNRPLQDKEWQAQAFSFVENVISHDPNGPAVIGPGLRPLSLTKFIEACDFLLKMLDENVGVTKHSYIKELPFLLGKKMLYKGKMEKSWMVAVSTQHAIPYALGVLHFLAQCANVLIKIDIDSYMFPSQFDNQQMDEVNFQILIPYYNRLYQIKKSEPSNYEVILEEWCSQVMQEHYEQDDALNKGEEIKQQLERIQSEFENMAPTRDLAKHEFEALAYEYQNVRKNLTDKEADLVKCRMRVSSLRSDLSDTERALCTADSDLKFYKEEHDKLLKKASEQAITLRDIDNMKKKRDSIDRGIVSNQKYIQTYRDMIYTEDIEILKLKTAIEELTRESNFGIMKRVRFDPEFEKMILPAKMEEFDSGRLDLQKSEIEKLKVNCETRSMGLLSDKSVAEQKRNQIMELVSNLKAANEDKRVNLDSLIAERESMLDSLKKLKHSQELEWRRLPEKDIMEKKLLDLNRELEAKQERLKNLRHQKEVVEKMLIEKVKSLGSQAAATMMELKKFKADIKKRLSNSERRDGVEEENTPEVSRGR